MSRMPAEWDHHERTIMGWPCRAELWEDRLEEAFVEYAAVANAIAAFEPVLMICRPGDAAAARPVLSAAIELWEAPIDDSWLRDSGPIFREDGSAACFAFNAWGEKFTPFDTDATIAPRLCERLGREFVQSPMILEGGSIAVDGLGTLITTEQCLLHPSRNPGMSREEIEAELREHLGADRVVWLQMGLVEDRDTDGHVDLVCVPHPSGGALLQTVAEDNPNFENMVENARRLDEAGIEVMPFDVLAYDDDVAMSYLNAYLCNGGVVVPQSGQFALDERALELYALAFPEREVVGVPGLTLAFGGGGPHCITQQVPSDD